jgi:hypothetical protein
MRATEQACEQPCHRDALCCQGGLTPAVVDAYRLPQLVRGWEAGLLRFLLARVTSTKSFGARLAAAYHGREAATQVASLADVVRHHGIKVGAVSVGMCVPHAARARRLWGCYYGWFWGGGHTGSVPWGKTDGQGMERRGHSEGPNALEGLAGGLAGFVCAAFSVIGAGLQEQRRLRTAATGCLFCRASGRASAARIQIARRARQGDPCEPSDNAAPLIKTFMEKNPLFWRLLVRR